MDSNFHKIEDKDITLTPLSLIEKLGKFDLDPCGILTHETADNIISLPTNGLETKWFGRVWLNPPYSAPKPWLEKLSEYKNGIALVLNSTDTEWFQNTLKTADSLFLLKGRPKFTRLDGSRVSIMRGVVLFGFGEQNSLALQESGLEGYFVRL